MDMAVSVVAVIPIVVAIKVFCNIAQIVYIKLINNRN